MLAPDSVSILGGAAIVGAVASWIVQRVLTSPDKAKADLEAARDKVKAETDAIRAELEMLKAHVKVIDQQVSGSGLGLVAVVGRLANALERLDAVVGRIDARLEAAG